MIYEIKNEKMTVKVSSFGAELQSVVCCGRECLWQGAEGTWSQHAPILFPLVGRSRDDVIITEGREYPAKKHGFASVSEFSVENIEESTITLMIKSNEETKKEYPYSFEFRVIYTITDNKLETRFSVKNTDDKPMYFNIGGHPGINCTYGDFEEWELVFEKSEPLLSKYVTDDCYISSKTPYELPQKDGVLRLQREFFKNDALIFEGLKSKTLTVRHSDKSVGATVNFSQFPILAIYSGYEKNASYVCVEPWCGSGFAEGENNILKDKNNSICTNPGEVKELAFDIEFF